MGYNDLSFQMTERQSDNREPTDDARKVFITNIEGSQSEKVIEEELIRLFERFGKVAKLAVKKNKSGLYAFAFLEFERPEEATRAISGLDQVEIFGKRMRVRQDRQNQGCFYCKKPGHFARECPDNREKEEERSRPQPPRQYPPQPYNDRRHRDYENRERYGYDERQRYYRDERHREERYERRYTDPYRERRHGHRRQHSRSRSPSYDPHRRRYNSRSRSDSLDRHHNRHRDRYYEGRRERRDPYYRHEGGSPSYRGYQYRR